MVDEIKDIVEWIKKYSFLDGVLKKYYEFDEPVEDDKYHYKYVPVCDLIVTTPHENINKHKNFCMKLVRNLGHHSENDEFLNYNRERCKDLNNWIYNSMTKHKIPKSIITGCFQEYNFHMNGIRNDPRCFDYSYDKIYDDTINIIILKIFESNMEIVKNIISRNDPINNTLQNYVCECVKIYKELKSYYCPNGDTHDINGKDTCNLLRTLKQTYMSFIYNQPHKNYKIPSLDNVEADYVAKCVPQELKRLVSPTASDTETLDSSLASADYGNPRESPSPEAVNKENQKDTLSSTVSTAVGTVAGASSVLALLYKFSPARKLVHSGIRGNSGIMNSNFYEDGPTDLLFDGVQGEDMDSYNTRYNISYGSV
ncbi:Plasmodium vivax Vir protein, putative [Plasmodium vivax]|nr:Plasmodium vivax Vir protein, putative [Plasmodium vivax]